MNHYTIQDEDGFVLGIAKSKELKEPLEDMLGRSIESFTLGDKVDSGGYSDLVVKHHAGHIRLAIRSVKVYE